VIPRLDETRTYWTALDPRVRDDPVAELYGFGEETWRNLRRAIGPGDRYSVVAEGEGQYEIRNYASYRLLPAIMVRDPEEADVVVYWDVVPPKGQECEPMGKGVCAVRRVS